MKFQPGDQLIEKSEHISAGYLPVRRTVDMLTLRPGYVLSLPSGGSTGELSREYVEMRYELEQPEEKGHDHELRDVPKRYTLDEARKELARQECFWNGHDYRQIHSFANDGPVRIVCDRGCGKSWKVAEDADL